MIKQDRLSRIIRENNRFIIFFLSWSFRDFSFFNTYIRTSLQVNSLQDAKISNHKATSNGIVWANQKTSNALLKANRKRQQYERTYWLAQKTTYWLVQNSCLKCYQQNGIICSTPRNLGILFVFIVWRILLFWLLFEMCLIARTNNVSKILKLKNCPLVFKFYKIHW